MNCMLCQRELAASEAKTGICYPCEQTHPDAARVRNEAETWARGDHIMLTTEAYPAGLTVAERIGIVSAECAFGMHFFKDLFTQVTDIVGGRSSVIQETLRTARERVLADLRADATALGADAVIGIGFQYNQFSGQGKSMIFVVALGTAVTLQRDAAQLAS